MKPARRTGCARSYIPYSSCMQMQPSANSPSAKIRPPSITMNSAKAIAGTAAISRALRSERCLRGAVPEGPRAGAGVILTMFNELDTGTFKGAFVLPDHVPLNDHLGDDFQSAKFGEGRRIIKRYRGPVQNHEMAGMKKERTGQAKLGPVLCG